MNSAVINIKTEPKIKIEAQKVAKEMGVSLSSLVNALLKDVIRTKKVTSVTEEIPTKRLIAAMKKAREDRKKGLASPIFKTGEEAVKWLEKQGI